MSEPVAGWL
jgi:hypothetical protein